MRLRWATTALSGVAGIWTLSMGAASGADGAGVRLLVMDPLSKQLACDCVAGYAQRDYPRLAVALEKGIGRKVSVSFAEALTAPEVGAPGDVGLIAGKYSSVVFDARRAGVAVRPIAMLSGQDGEITLRGLFVVRSDDSAKSVKDLGGRSTLFGPEDADEKRSAALATLEAFGLPVPREIRAAGGCTAAAAALVDRDAEAAVVSTYAMPLLKGCGTIREGELKIVGETDPVPFVGIFATGSFPEALDGRLREALLGVAEDASLLKALESRDGFVAMWPIRDGADGPVWGDWRGPGRRAFSRDVPRTLADRPRVLWRRTLTGPGMAGLAVGGGRVIVADKGDGEKTDIFRCLDADTGRELWRLEYPATGDMDFTNSARATPVIHRGLVYLLGAFGHLHCVRLETGEVVWKRNIVDDFGAELPAWGTCATPLLAGDRLIVNPGAEGASLVALDPGTGEVQWKVAGAAAAYASFVLARFGGVEQVVGYDGISLGGWDPATGRRLWQLVPEAEGDFNVPTPIVMGERLLVATENNGTRLYGFDRGGKILPTPVAKNGDLVPDTSTPVVAGDLVFGNSAGLYCLDLQQGLATAWKETGAKAFGDYCSFIAGGDRVLVMAVGGRLSLIEASRDGLRVVAAHDMFPDVPEAEREVWSHPALAGNRLYVRNLLEVACFLLAPPPGGAW